MNNVIGLFIQYRKPTKKSMTTIQKATTVTLFKMSLSGNKSSKYRKSKPIIITRSISPSVESNIMDDDQVTISIINEVIF